MIFTFSYLEGKPDEFRIFYHMPLAETGLQNITTQPFYQDPIEGAIVPNIVS